MLRLLLKLVYTANTLVEALIIVRVFLSIFAKSSTHSFVEWVNSISEIFISPFKDIVPSVLVIDNFEITITPVIALFFYAIAGFVLSELIKAFSSN